MPHLTLEEIQKLKAKVLSKEIKMGNFDLETSYVTARIWDTGKQWINHNQVIGERKIITAQFMYSLSNEPQFKCWKTTPLGFNDHDVVKWIVKRVNECDIVIAQNGKQFDWKVLQERAMLQELPPVEIDFMIDTLTASRSSFKSFSHSLDHQSTQLGLGGKIKMEMQNWIDIVEKGVSPSVKMVPYGLKDIQDTDEVFWAKLHYYNLPQATINKIRRLIKDPQNNTIEHKEYCAQCAKNRQSRYKLTFFKKKSTEYVKCNNCTTEWLKAKP